VLAAPARASRRVGAAVDAAVRGLAMEPDPLRITRVAAVALALDRVTECREPLRRALAAGPPGTAASGLLCAGDVATGRWDEAEELAEEALGTRRLPAAPWLLAGAEMAAARGDELRTRVLVDAAADQGAHAGDVRRVLALAALGRGDVEDAYRHATAATPAGRLADAGPASMRVSMDLVEAAVRLGRKADAHRHARAMRDAPVHAVSPRFAMLTAASAALVAGPDDAAAGFERALAAPDAERWPFDQARIQLAYGEHLRRQRRLGPSRALLGDALDTFLRFAAGMTIGGPVEPGAAAALTSDERRVVVLAAAGLTNKQIARQLMLSHHTVAARLYQVFPKLGVGSRAALRDAMLALDGDPAA
jgi:DNA-binding CsgD family transcriptional regulator